jgi:hypothetical protein
VMSGRRGRCDFVRQVGTWSAGAEEGEGGLLGTPGTLILITSAMCVAVCPGIRAPADPADPEYRLGRFTPMAHSLSSHLTAHLTLSNHLARPFRGPGGHGGAGRVSVLPLAWHSHAARRVRI